MMYLRFVGVAAVVCLLAFLGLGSSNSSFPLSKVQKGRVLGGQQGDVEICAKEVQNASDSCYLRVQGSKPQYRCYGKELDQVCLAATTNTGSYCDKGEAVCSGKQEKRTSPEDPWVADGDCKNCTYATARLQEGKCIVGGK